MLDQKKEKRKERKNTLYHFSFFTSPWRLRPLRETHPLYRARLLLEELKGVRLVAGKNTEQEEALGQAFRANLQAVLAICPVGVQQ